MSYETEEEICCEAGSEPAGKTAEIESEVTDFVGGRDEALVSIIERTGISRTDIQ